MNTFHTYPTRYLAVQAAVEEACESGHARYVLTVCHHFEVADLSDLYTEHAGYEPDLLVAPDGSVHQYH